MVVGGLLIILGGLFNSKSADRRLKMQLDREDQRRQQERIIAAQLEPIENLMALIKSATAVMPEFLRDSSVAIPTEIFDPALTNMQRAMVSMRAIGEEEASETVHEVGRALSALFDAIGDKTARAAGGLVPNLSISLAALEKRYTELKVKAIREGGMK